MEKILKILLILATATAMSGSGVVPGHELDCLGSLRAAFAKAGHSPDIDCKGKKLSTRNEFLGEIRFKNVKYRVYHVRFHFNPIPTNTHWGERLFVFNGKGAYVGEYAMAGFYDRFHIVGHALVSDLRVKDNKIVFTPSGPPKTTIYGGEPIEFYR